MDYISQIIFMDNNFVHVFILVLPVIVSRSLHRNSGEWGGNFAGTLVNVREVLVNIVLGVRQSSPNFARLRQSSPNFAKLRHSSHEGAGRLVHPGTWGPDDVLQFSL